MMKKQILIGLIVILLGMAYVGNGYHSAIAGVNDHILQNVPPVSHLLTAPTPLPTAEPILIGYPTPIERVLPPVGSNAGLVIGASILVLIIIGGVLGARARQKH